MAAAMLTLPVYTPATSPVVWIVTVDTPGALLEALLVGVTLSHLPPSAVAAEA
jgi:hypothetical protein